MRRFRAVVAAGLITSYLFGAHVGWAAQVTNVTLTQIFVDRGSVLLYYQGDSTTASNVGCQYPNPSSKDTTLFSLSPSHPLFREIYSLALTALASGKKVRIGGKVPCEGGAEQVDYMDVSNSGQ